MIFAAAYALHILITNCTSTQDNRRRSAEVVCRSCRCSEANEAKLEGYHFYIEFVCVFALLWYLCSPIAHYPKSRVWTDMQRG
jgi:hypothetical protein